MVQTRPLYGLADLPPTGFEEPPVPFRLFSRHQIGATPDNLPADGFDVATPTLASLGAFRFPGLRYDAPALIDGEKPSTRGNFDRGLIQTALLRGGGATGDALRPSPSLIQKVSDDEILPIRPGQPVQHKALDEEPIAKRIWHPLQIDLPRFDAPQGVPDRMTRLLNKPGLEDQMMEAIGAGRTMMQGDNWYDADFLRDRFVKRRGDNLGTHEFLQLIDILGATSPGSDVGTNIRNASFYFNKIRRGEPLPDSSSSNPYPYGHWLRDRHLMLLGMLMSGALNPIIYPKITSYSQNLKGNVLPVTNDIHALRLPVMLARDANFLKQEYREKLQAGQLSMDEAVANPTYWRNLYPNEYAALEQFYKKLARRANLSPAEAQAAAWIGGSHITGVRTNGLWTFKQQFEDRIRRTAKKWGMSEEQVWDLFIDGELDLARHDDQLNSVA